MRVYGSCLGFATDPPLAAKRASLARARQANWSWREALARTVTRNEPSERNSYSAVARQASGNLTGASNALVNSVPSAAPTAP